MQKEIKYTGFSETPSDYECPDGDLATVVGMVPEDEAMKPIQQPTTLFKLPNNTGGTWSVVFIHKNTGFTNYIVCWERTVDSVNEKAYYWIDPTSIVIPDDRILEPAMTYFNSNNLIATFDDKEVYELNALGKTLMFLTDEGVHYCLWEGAPDNNYKDLGNVLPETLLSFGLQGELISRRMEYYNVEIAGNIDLGDWSNNAGANRELSMPEWFSERTMALINRYTKEYYEDKNKFIYPFFVRYAYRLYDESLAMFSVPILMVTDASGLTPRAPIVNIAWGGSTFDYKGEVNFIAYDLDYLANIPAELSNWSDIIKSVDIFVSAPLYNYDQSGKITAYHNAQTDAYTEGLNPTEHFNGYTVGHILRTDARWAHDEAVHYSPTFPSYNNVKYMKQDSAMYRAMYNTSRTPDATTICRDWVVPHFNKSKITKDVKDCHTFYLIKSIPIEELAQVRTKIELESGCLSTLLVKEVMTDEATATNNFIARTSFVYNQRINFANMSYKLRNPAPAQVCSAYTDDTPQVQYDIYVYVRDEIKEVIVKADDVLNFQEDQDPFASTNPYNPFVYFYYANPNATKVVIKKHGTPDVVYEFELSKHDFLNGAVFFDGWFPTVTASTENPVPSEDALIKMPNKLYTSEVANPFVFTSRGIQTVGVGTILGVRPIVKAMSLAQYGQHDLYVFSSDGVWSLEVDSEGYMQHPHLATPDIVLGNGGSISQIDGGVLFATDRGIMLISGSDSVCISDMLNSTSPFIPIGTTAAQDLLPGLRNVVDPDMLAQMQSDTFRNFITDCRMTYDYPHQRIIVYSPTHDYAYVYSLKSKQWGMMPSKIQSTPLNYPAALAMVVGSDSRNWLVDYSKDDIVQGVIQVESGLIITRPLKLDYPDVLKTVDTIIQRGKFQKGHVKSILYGSRDLLNWQLVWSSVDHYLRGFSGTPYKYFRLALICDLAEGEGLMGCTVQFTPRLTDQLR